MKVLLLAFAALWGTGCSVNHVHHRTHRVIRPEVFERNTEYVFHYYPEAEVYHCPRLKVYAVYKTAGWTIVYERPAVLRPHHRHVVIKEKNCRPWWRHAYYREYTRKDKKKGNRRGYHKPVVHHNRHVHIHTNNGKKHRDRTVINNHYHHDKPENRRHTVRQTRRRDVVKRNEKGHRKDEKYVRHDNNRREKDEKRITGRVPGYNNPHIDKGKREAHQKTKEVKIHQWSKNKNERGRTDNGRFVKVEKEKKTVVKNSGKTKKVKTKTRVVRNDKKERDNDRRSGNDKNKGKNKNKAGNNGKKHHAAAW